MDLQINDYNNKMCMFRLSSKKFNSLQVREQMYICIWGGGGGGDTNKAMQVKVLSQLSFISPFTVYFLTWSFRIDP